MLDTLVSITIVALFVLAGSLVVLFSSEFERVDASDTALYIFWGLTGAALPVVFLYLFVGLAWKGQTLGAAALQIMVVRSDGRPLGSPGAMARVTGLLTYPLVLAVAGFVGYVLGGSGGLVLIICMAVAVSLVTAAIVWAAFDSHRRMLHDRFAGTIIVRLT